MTVINKINENLDVLYDVNDDPIYKSLICNKDGTIPGTITKPTDFDIGAIGSQIEYLRRLSIDLAKQIFVDQAEAEFLIYTLENFFDSLRLEDETDSEWVVRTIATVLSQKVSRASIIFLMRPFSTVEPVITLVITESAFADFSFANVYIPGSDVLAGETIYVLPAIAEDFDSSFYTFKITLVDTPLSELWTVTNTLDKIIGAGITYILQINYT